MARRAGAAVTGRIRKRFIFLVVGLVALAVVYVSSKRASDAIQAKAPGAGAGAARSAAASDASVQWTNFFGSEEGAAEAAVAAEEPAAAAEEPAEEEPAAEAPAEEAPAAASPSATPEPPAPATPTASTSAGPTPSKSAAAQTPTPSAAGTPPATPSNSGKPAPPTGTPSASKPVPSSPVPTGTPSASESAKQAGAAAAAAGGEPARKLPPQSQLRAVGDFMAPSDVIAVRPAQSEAERKASPRYDAELDYDFKDTAFVSMAAGDDAGRQVVGLVASLRASKTLVQDIVVMLSRGGVGSVECRGEDGGAWKRENKRTGISCSGPDTVPEEIIGVHTTNVLRQLGAVLTVVDPIPSTPFTEAIPGGRSFFWGMALNKLLVFNMTSYKRIVWMDSDTMVLKNVDHLFQKPVGTMAFTYACCNPNAPVIPSGGLWVLEPSLQLGAQIWRMMTTGKPAFSNKGEAEMETLPDGRSVHKREYWHWGDMQLMRWFYSYWPLAFEKEPLWPQIDDHNHGAVEGLQYFPQYKKKTPAELEQDRRATTGNILPEGWHGQNWDGVTTVWRSLDTRYDQCVGHCECLPGRDMPDEHITLHFSCLQSGINKPGGYSTEAALGQMMYDNAMSCTRHYSWHVWYQQYFVPAFGRLPEPHWTGNPIPAYNETHDEYVKTKRMEKKR